MGYGGLICYGEEAHITTIAVDLSPALGDGTRLLYGSYSGEDMGGRRILEVRVTNWGAQRLTGGPAAPSGSGRTTTRRSTRTP